jgi:hypothetical protein
MATYKCYLNRLGSSQVVQHQTSGSRARYDHFSSQFSSLGNLFSPSVSYDTHHQTNNDPTFHDLHPIAVQCPSQL